MNAIRPEYQLLLCTARTRPDAQSRPALEHLLSLPLDWGLFRQAAIGHGVAPLCFHFLGAVCPELIPAEPMESLRQHAKTVAGRNLLLASRLLALLRRLASDGVAAIPYKGPVLAAMAYRNLALREFDDLDLVLAERELPQAWQALEAEGYQVEQAASPAASSPVAPGQYAFRDPHGDYLVELHTELTLRHFPRPLDPARFSQSLRPVRLNGEEISTFSPEETLVFLSVHGAKDFWARLLWIADVAELIQIPEGFDWERALAAANDLGCGRMVRVATLLASGLLGAPIPPSVLSDVKRDRASNALAQTVSRWLFGDEAATVRERARYRMRMVEGFWSGTWYAWRLGTNPTTEDSRAVRLPRKLSFLYSLIRPIRLLSSRGKN